MYHIAKPKIRVYCVDASLKHVKLHLLYKQRDN